MASMVGGYQAAGHQQMHRKPLPAQAAPQRSQQIPQRHSPPNQTPQHHLPTPLQQPVVAAQQHSRSTSASAYPNASQYYVDPAQAPPSSYPAAQMNQYNQTRRTLSNATTSTSSSAALQRTGSTASGGQSTSYVALMRRQKATVWCDRSQYEDPRMIAQQKAAKRRAEREITGANASHAAARTSTSTSTSLTGGVRSKIRHHGTPKAQQYAPAANMASGVPMRLSAREVDEDDSDDENSTNRSIHQRTGSGRSSMGSVGRGSGVPTAQYTTGGTPPSGRLSQDQRSPVLGDTEPTPVPDQFQGENYFDSSKGSEGRDSAGSTDRENSFGGVKGLPRRVKPEGRSTMSDEDLTRRGSVDERTTTMTGMRLVIANPDVD